MAAEVYDQIQIEDLDLDAETGIFYYPCPCGDKFVFSMEELQLGEQIARCPSCSLTIRVVYDKNSYEEYCKVVREMRGA